MGHLSRQLTTLKEITDVSTSILTAGLRTETSRPQRNITPETSQRSQRINSVFSLLSIQVPRKHRSDEQFLQGIDDRCSKSLDDAEDNKRLHAGPRGIHIAMGSINQYSRPKQQISDCNGVLDIFWMKMTVEDRELWTSEQPWKELQQNMNILLDGKSIGREMKTTLIILHCSSVSGFLFTYI